MTKTSTNRAHEADETMDAGEWQQAYMASAVAVGASWCDFMGERFQAYAHVIDDVSHCHDLGEAWQLQTNFGQETVKAYSDQAARLSSLLMRAAKGEVAGRPN